MPRETKNIFVLSMCLLVIIIPTVSPSKILIWSPIVGRSHVKFMSKIADLLVSEGHNVTLLETTFDPDSSPDYDTRAQNVIIHHPTGYDPKLMNNFDYKNDQIFKRNENMLWPQYALTLLKVSVDQCHGLLIDDITVKMRNENFDLVIFELIDLCPGLWLQHLGVERIIAASSYGTAPLMEAVSGIHANPSYVPFIFNQATDQMTYFERVENVLYSVVQRLFLIQNAYELTELSKKVFPKTPIMDPIMYLSSHLSAYFINANEFSETARPVLKNMVYVGGLMVQDQQMALSGEYAHIYDSCSSGVVIFSFGSMVKTKYLSKATKTEIINAFSAFKNLCFIWKVDVVDLKNEHLYNETVNAENVFIRTWIPQQQLFADKRTKLFITHGGANSINEAFAFGIPVITVPLYLDNNHNSAAAVRRGLGVSLNKLDLTKSRISSAISEVIGNSSNPTVYEKRSKKMSQQLKRHRKRIEQNIIEWTEKILDFGLQDQMILASVHLNFFQLYCLDIVIPALAIVSILIYFFVQFLRQVIVKIVEFSDKNRQHYKVL